MASAHEKIVGTSCLSHISFLDCYVFSHGTAMQFGKHVSENIIGERIVSD